MTCASAEGGGNLHIVKSRSSETSPGAGLLTQTEHPKGEMPERIESKKLSQACEPADFHLQPPTPGWGKPVGCDTSTRRNGARLRGAEAEVPRERANGIRGRSCLVLGFYLDVWGPNIILKYIFSRPFGSEGPTQDPRLGAGFILSDLSCCRTHFGFWLAPHQTLPAPDLK